MQDNKKRTYKKIKREDMDIPGCATGVKVVNGNIELALKMWKRKVKDSGKIEELKNRKEFLKPSAIKRKQKQQAIRAEYRRRMFEN